MINSKKQALAMSVLCAVASVGFVAGAGAEETMKHELAPVIVEADADVLPGGLAKSTQAVGLLGSQDIMDVPFTVNTVTEKTITTFSNPYGGIANALTLTPSVRPAQSGTYTTFSIRGKTESGHGIYVNGIPGLMCNGNLTNDWIESATVISGPNLGVNGSTLNEAVGGSVNFISKKAQKDQKTKLKFTYLGGSRFEESVDAGQRFGKDDRYGVQINAATTHGEGEISNAYLYRQGIHLNLDQKSEHSKTNLLVGYEHTNQEGSVGGVSFASSVTSLPSAPSNNKYFKPSWTYNEYKNTTVALNHEQKINEHISAFVNAGYHREDWYGYLDGGTTVTDNFGNLKLSGYSNYPLDFVKRYVGIGFKGDFAIGAVKNDYTVGVDRNWMSYAISNNPAWSWAGGTGNLYNFDNNAYPNPAGKPNYKPAHNMNQYQTGWHVVDTLKALDDKLNITLGLHGHKITRNLANGTSQESDAVCPTYAVSYKISPDVTVFADHTESFGVGSMVATNKDYANAGEMLDPAKTKQNEIGVKFKTGSLMNTVSAFQIKQANNVDKYIGGDKYLVQDGEMETKGLEWAVSGQIGQKWDLIGGLMYLRAEDNEGADVNGASKWSASFGAIYHPDEDWAVKGRINYLGSSTINNGALSVPSYCVFDLGAAYKTKLGAVPVTIDAMCYNITDKDYWQAQAGSSSLFLGGPRTFVVSATFEI